MFRQRIRTRPSARPCRSLRRAAGIGPEVGTSVRPAASACGRCLRRGGAARTWSRPRAVAAGPASRDGGERAGDCRGRGFRGYRSGGVGRAARAEADAWFPRLPSGGRRQGEGFGHDRFGGAEHRGEQGAGVELALAGGAHDAGQDLLVRGSRAFRQAGGGRARASGTTGSGAQSIVVNRARGSSWRWRAVRTTLARICWCVVPAPSVRRAAAGRGLRARPVRGRRASW